MHPDCVARTASGIVPCAVSRMTLSPGQRFCSSLSRPMPSISAMRRSEMTRSGRKSTAESSAPAALATGSTSYFSDRSRIVSRRSRPGSSSTTRMRAGRCLRVELTAVHRGAWRRLRPAPSVSSRYPRSHRASAVLRHARGAPGPGRPSSALMRFWVSASFARSCASASSRVRARSAYCETRVVNSRWKARGQPLLVGRQPVGCREQRSRAGGCASSGLLSS